MDIWPHLEATAKRAGLSVSEFIRETVYERLDESSQEATREELEKLQQSVETMRVQLIRAARAILVVAGSRKEFSPVLADEWVERNFGAQYLKKGDED